MAKPPAEGAKRIPKTEQRLQQTSYGGGVALLGLPFAAIGIAVAGAGIQWWPLPGKANAPLEVIAAVGLAFALAGIWLITLGLRGWWRRSRLDARLREHPDEPWWGDYPWHREGLRDRPVGKALAAVWGMLFFGIFLAPFNWWAWLSSETSFFVQAIVSLFDLILVLGFFGALHKILQALKYGQTQVAFSRFPFYPGEEVALFVSPLRGAAPEVTVRYVEERTVTRRRSNETHSHHEAWELWGTTLEVDATQAEGPRAAAGGALPIRFTLPDEPDFITDFQGGTTIRYWELVLNTPESGINHRTTFPIPVYAPPSFLGDPTDRTVDPRWPPIEARSGAGFEIKLIIAILAVIGLGLGLGWEQATHLWTRFQLTQGVETLEPFESETLDVAIHSDGTVWMLAKYDVRGYPASNLETPDIRIGNGGQQLGRALSAVGLTDDDEVWLGGWYGELYRSSPSGVQTVVSVTEGDALKIGRITGFTTFRGQTYFVARGVWRILEDRLEVAREATLPPRSGGAIVSSDSNGIYAALGRNLWHFDGEIWRQAWQAPKADRWIYSVVRIANTLVIGTENGIAILDADGEVEHRALEGTPVTALTQAYDHVWAATRSGLVLSPGNELTEWRSAVGTTSTSSGISGAGFPAISLTDLAFDADGNLWATSYEEGAKFISAELIERLLSTGSAK